MFKPSERVWAPRLSEQFCLKFVSVRASASSAANLRRKLSRNRRFSGATEQD
jgi:hypothetical protein